ncbi:hypothetical protein ACIPJM_29525, partial [Streptomyces halstedii]|uniref:hypothetical protein n=1 Tax=Streptomyces halstedii TaxID=1944 RepID=UPI00381FE9C8
EYIQYADVPPPCDPPHLTPRADPPGITGQPLGISWVKTSHAGSSVSVWLGGANVTAEAGLLPVVRGGLDPAAVVHRADTVRK